MKISTPPGMIFARRALALVFCLALASARGAAIQSNWIGGTSGTWEDAINWMNSDASSAFPNNGGGNTFNVNTGGSGVTVGVNSPITLDGLMLGTGAIGINAGGSLTIEGAFGWSGTTFLSGPGPLNGKGSTSITGAVTLLTTFVNTGTINVSTMVSQLGGGVLQNDAGGTFNLSGDGGGNSWEIHNSGAINKNASGVTSLTGAFFNENAGSVSVTAGTLSLGAAGSYGGASSISVNGGALTFQNAAHTFTDSATISGTGTVLIAGGASGVFNAVNTSVGAPVTLRGSVTGSGTVTFSNSLRWESGSMGGAGTTNATGDIEFANPANVTNARTLNITGGATVGDVGNIDNTGIIELRSALTIETDADISGGSGGLLHIGNGGDLRKRTATGDTFISCRLNNDAFITVDSGRMILDGPGTNTGFIEIAAGATLRLSNNFRSFIQSPVFDGVSGAGTLEFFAGTNDFNGATRFKVDSPTTMNGGVLGGDAVIEFKKPFTWNTGKMTNAGTTITHTLSLETAGTKTNERRIELAGGSSWHAGNINNSGGTIVVTPGVTFGLNLAADASLSSGTLDNQGFIEKLGAGTANVSAFLRFTVPQGGTARVTASAGRLKLSGGGEHHGPFRSFSTIDFAGGTHVFHPGATLDGNFDYTAGTCRFLDGVNTTTGALVLQNAGHTIINEGILNLDAGVAQYSGTVRNSATMFISGYSIWDGDLQNTGTATLTGGPMVLGANQGNTGVFTIAPSGNMTGTSYTFTNSGDLCVNGRCEVSFVDNYDTLSGKGTMTGAVTNHSVCKPGATLGDEVGTLTAGSFTQTAASELRVQVGGPGDADRLDVTGGLVLGGFLRIEFAPVFEGTFAPADTLVIASAGAPITSSFANVASGARLFTMDGSASFRVFYGAGSSFPASQVVLTDFKVEQTPATVTLSVDGITQTGATLHGTVDPGGFPATAKFVHGETIAYGNATSSVNVGFGQSPVPVNIAISGLQPNTLYHFQLVGTNSAGDANGGDLTFTTLPNPPTVVTQAATDITPSSATLHGTVNPNGAVPAARFQIGETNAYGTNSDYVYLNAGTTAQPMQTTVSGLKAHTRYHFRLTATNNGGTTDGQDLTFTTTNTPPEAVDDVAYAAGKAPIAIAVLANDSDADDDTLTITSATGATFGKLTHDGTTITYTPKTKYQRTDQFTYTISDGAETATATVVVRQRFQSSPGTFDGLVTNTAPNNDNQGFLRATVNAKGTYTGRLMFGGFTHALSGKFDDDGHLTKLIKRAAPLEPLTLDLTLDSGAHHLAGTIAYGTVVSQTDTTQTPYRAANPPLQLGDYTLGLPANPAHPEPEFPQGDGFATMDIGRTGTVAVKGKLGDGTAFTSSSLLKDDHTFALYCGLYVKKPAQRGSVVGPVSVGPAAAINLAATLRWYKPPQTSGAFYKTGFATEIALVGSRYVMTRGVSVLGLPGGNGQCTIGGGNLTAFGLALSVSAADKVTTPPPNARLFAMTIARNTGLVSGRFNVTTPAGKTLRRNFHGAVLQDRHKAHGCFLDTDQSGYVRVEP